MPFEVGQVIVRRYLRGRWCTWAQPMRVISDDGTGLLLWQPAGSDFARLVDADGNTPHEVPPDRMRDPQLTIQTWQDYDVLILVPPAAAYSVWWLFQEGSFTGWYVNLEAPYVRLSTGVPLAPARASWVAGGTVGCVLGTGELALALRGLYKRFDTKIAVAGVDLDVPAGSFYGLLGPNGAGKTTTLSMAVGLLRPDAGSASVLGHDVWTDPVSAKRRLGALPDGVRLFDRLSGPELLAYTGLLRGMDPATVDQRATELLDVLALGDAGRTLVVDYSAGMKKKIALACALLHAPRLLVLDEPFEAVDPVSAALIRDILGRYVAGGGTVIFSSHVMEVVERLCSHVAILDQGVIKTVGTLDAVRGGRALEEVFVEVVGGRTATGDELSWL